MSLDWQIPQERSSWFCSFTNLCRLQPVVDWHWGGLAVHVCEHAWVAYSVRSDSSVALFCGHSADGGSFSPPPAGYMCVEAWSSSTDPRHPFPFGSSTCHSVHRELSLGWGGDLSVEAGYFCLSAGKPEASVTFPPLSECPMENSSGQLTADSGRGPSGLQPVPASCRQLSANHVEFLLLPGRRQLTPCGLRRKPGLAEGTASRRRHQVPPSLFSPFSTLARLYCGMKGLWGSPSAGMFKP